MNYDVIWRLNSSIDSELWHCLTSFQYKNVRLLQWRLIKPIYLLTQENDFTLLIRWLETQSQSRELIVDSWLIEKNKKK